MGTELERQLDELRPGDHLCLIYESREEQLAAALPFLTKGIRSGRRCLYIVDDLTAQDVRDALSATGVDVGAAEADGILEFRTKGGTYHTAGHFEPSGMLALMDEEIRGAEERELTPAHITGEMTWALGPELGNDRLIEYEASLNDFVRCRQTIIVCQYNRTRFSPEIIRDILRTHPIAILGGVVCPNPYYEPPAAVLGRADAGEEVERMISTLRAHRGREMDTERREQEMALVLEQTPDIIARHDADGRVLFVNPAVTGLTGREPRELLGRTLEQAGFAAETADPLRRAITEALASDEPVTFEHPVSGPGGRRWLHTRVVPQAASERHPEGVLVIGRDVTGEVEHREEIRRSEQRYRTLFQQSQDAVFITREDGTVVDANPACLRLFGYDRDEFFALPATRHYVDPEDRDRILDSLRSDGEVQDFPVRFLRKDGEHRHCLISTIPWDHDGERGLHGVIRDHTELWTRTRELQERVKELRCLYGVSTLLVRSREPLSAVLEEVVRLVADGVQFDELAEARLHLGSTRWSTPNFRTTPWSHTVSVSSDDETVTLEVAYREAPPVEGDAYFLPEEKDLVQALAERIAETVSRRAAGEALARREEHFRTLIEEGSDLISIMDADGTIRYESPSVAKLLGWQAGELVGSGMQELLHPDDVAPVQDELDRVMDDPSEPGLARYRIRHRDGTWRTVETVIRNLLDDPAVAGVVANTRDITERVELEQRLLQSQKLEAVGRLAGGVAHDFNNLLTAIRGYAALLMADLPEEHSGHRDALEIQTAVDRGASLTRQLLAFSRKQVMRPEVVRPDEAVREMENMLSRLIGEDVVLSTRLCAPDSSVIVDRGQLEQVVMNLVVNARDAMPRGGTILVETERRVVGEDAQHAPGAWTAITVRDTGTGIPDELRERIFEPFFTTKDDGTGLGLATVFGIVTQSGGHVGFESELGKGTVFEVLLPETGEEGPEETAPAPEERPLPTGTETVLLAEDDAAVRSVARRILERGGYTVLEAGTGEEAALRVREHDGIVHLLLTDMVMPDGGGRALARSLEEIRPDIRTIYMSGYSSGREAAEMGSGGEAAGSQPQPFLPKPFTPEKLLRSVRRVLDGESELE